MTHLVPSRRIVIADDDDDMRMLVEIAARKAGLDIAAVAVDGHQAWRAIQNHRPDVAVLDVSMPGMSGLDVCRLVRSDPSVTSTLMLLLSAGVSWASREAGIQAGADDFMAKPFSPRILGEKLATLSALRAASE